MNGHKIYSLSMQQARIKLYIIKIIHDNHQTNMIEKLSSVMPRAHFQSLHEMPRLHRFPVTYMHVCCKNYYGNSVINCIN